MTKKKANKEQIDSVKSSLYYKIFDIIQKDNKKYYLDKEFNLIWDDKKDVVGIIDKKDYYFFEDLDILMENIKNNI
jgi:hypothetical protein